MTVIDDIHHQVGEIGGMVKLLVEQGRIQDDRHNALESRVRAVEANTALETRVRAVEGRQHWYAGVAAGVSALLTALGTKWFGH